LNNMRYTESCLYVGARTAADCLHASTVLGTHRA